MTTLLITESNAPQKEENNGLDINGCDEEWLQFCDNNYNYEPIDNKSMESICNTIVSANIENDLNDTRINTNININKNKNVEFIDVKNTNLSIPEPTNIYISTKTKIGYFEKELDIASVFWQIEIIPIPKVMIVKNKPIINNVKPNMNISIFNFKFPKIMMISIYNFF